MDNESDLRALIGDDPLEKAVASKIKSFHGLLTREAAIRLLAKEKGLLKSEEEKLYKLAEIPNNTKKISFSATIKKIWPIATYSSGKKSRVLEVEDGSASKPLVLWNDDVDLAVRLRVRDKIKVKGAYEKSGELHLGYTGDIEVEEKAGFSDLSDLKEGSAAHLRGVISKIEGNDMFVRNGKNIAGFSFFLTDGKIERRCLIIDGLGRTSALKKDQEVIIENAHIGTNIEIGENSRILAKKSNRIAGTVDRLDCSGEVLEVSVGGKHMTLDRENALRLFGAVVAPDIALSTVAALKRDSILNSRIALKVEDKDGKTVVSR